MSVFLSSLQKFGYLDRLAMVVCNIGSRKLDSYDDYGSQGWGIFAPRLTIYGFDADEAACAQANQDLQNRAIAWREHHIPLALGNRRGLQTLYITKHPMCSSLYPPNEPYLARFAGLPELVNLDRTVSIATTTLDQYCQEQGISRIDFLQIDIQGAELDVLTSSPGILSTVLAIQTEVEFAPLYQNQPLFADVDIFLRSQGFHLFGLVQTYRHRLNYPLPADQCLGQVLWGDAFYLRDALADPMDQPEKILKLACIADILGFSDYSLELLVNLTRHHGPSYNFAPMIYDRLSQDSGLVAQGLENLPVIQALQEFLEPVLIIGGQR